MVTFEVAHRAAAATHHARAEAQLPCPARADTVGDSVIRYRCGGAITRVEPIGVCVPPDRSSAPMADSVDVGPAPAVASPGQPVGGGDVCRRRAPDRLPAWHAPDPPRARARRTRVRRIALAHRTPIRLATKWSTWCTSSVSRSRSSNTGDDPGHQCHSDLPQLCDTVLSDEVGDVVDTPGPRRAQEEW